MQRTIIACVLTAAVVLATTTWVSGQRVASVPPAGADGKKEPPTLRTTGSATVRIKPDAARLFFGVQTQAATVKEARTENNTRIRKIQEALAALKIPDLKTKTSDVQVEILYGRVDGGQLPPITGYRVSNTFTVLVSENDAARLGTLSGRVLDAALGAGVNTVQQVVFLNRSGTTEARRKALSQAVEDALANAKALAAGAGKGQVDAFSIDGQPLYRYEPRNRMLQTSNVAVPDGADSDGVLVVGELEMTCQVSIACTF